MKTNTSKLFAFFIAVLFSGSLTAQETPGTITGYWQGVLDVGSVKLHIGFSINDSAGQFIAKLDSPDQGAFGIPMDSVTWIFPELTIFAGNMAAQYNGTLQKGDSLIEGKWTQSGQSFDLVLHKAAGVYVPDRPQEPVAPFPYEVSEVEIVNHKDNIVLAGTLTMPEGAGPFPAVVLVSGSGPQDRDEALLGHKPFLVIADYLTRNGIAVLRYDDRGVGKSGGSFAKSTSFDFASDAEAAFKFLLTQNEIDPKRIGIAGHSEGGLIAPIVAVNNPDLGFIILMAGPGTSGHRIILDQTRLIMEKSGEQEATINESVVLTDKLIRILKAESDSAAASRIMYEEIVKQVNAMKSVPADAKPSMISQSQAGVAQMNTPWFRTFVSYEPSTSLVKVKCPVLALNGTLDLQVPCETNLLAIEKYLKKGGNKNIKTVRFDGLNHLFQHTQTGLPSEYGEIEETFSTEVMDVMVEWIKGL